jgi:predicted DCC family thiol-disulfide oxidoreductase YuxK
VTHPILLYDGVCGLCNRLNQFVLGRDAAGIFRFASLQSALASRVLQRHGESPQDLDTFYVIVNPDQPDEYLRSRSDAAIFVMQTLGGFWRAIGAIMKLVPKALRDWVYRLIARNRYRVFGRADMCFLPPPRYRERFLDV